MGIMHLGSLNDLSAVPENPISGQIIVFTSPRQKVVVETRPLNSVGILAIPHRMLGPFRWHPGRLKSQLPTSL